MKTPLARGAAAPIAMIGLLTLFPWHEAHAGRPAHLASSIMSTTDSAPASADAAARAEVQAALPQARLVGTGSLRFFGLLVYEARLWAAPGFDATRYDSEPFALELEYARKLDGGSIAERSVSEMRRVGKFSDDKARDWLALMLQAFPNVAAKDRLTGLHDGKGGVRFFHNTRPTAATVDREYAQLFFGIWLDPQTSSPALRHGLIGAGGS